MYSYLMGQFEACFNLNTFKTLLQFVQKFWVLNELKLYAIDKSSLRLLNLILPIQNIKVPSPTNLIIYWSSFFHCLETPPLKRRFFIIIKNHQLKKSAGNDFFCLKEWTYIQKLWNHYWDANDCSVSHRDTLSNFSANITQ